MTAESTPRTPQNPAEIERAEIGKRYTARLRVLAIVQGIAIAAIILFTTFADRSDLLLPLIVAVAAVGAVVLGSQVLYRQKELKQLENDHGTY